MQSRLAEMEEAQGDIHKAKKHAEHESQELRKKCQDIEMQLRKTESEKMSKEHAIRTLQATDNILYILYDA